MRGQMAGVGASPRWTSYLPPMYTVHGRNVIESSELNKDLCRAQFFSAPSLVVVVSRGSEGRPPRRGRGQQQLLRGPLRRHARGGLCPASSLLRGRARRRRGLEVAHIPLLTRGRARARARAEPREGRPPVRELGAGRRRAWRATPGVGLVPPCLTVRP